MRSLATSDSPDTTAPLSIPAESTPIDRWLFPLLGALSLLASCVLWSLKKQLAGDETFTHFELSDPSLGHLMHAALRLGGGAMPLFYLTAWPWAHVFGLSELSLRLYSSVATAAAFLVLTAALRRIYGARAAFLGAAFGLFASLLVVDQNVEARGYGLYLLLAALAVAQWLRVAASSRPALRDLVFLALSQAGLVLGHVLGLVYAALMLAALILFDRLQHRLRIGVYLTFIAGWLALIPWMPAIRASAALGKPHSWIAAPTLADLAVGLSYWLFGGIYYPLFRNHPLGLMLGWLCAILCVGALVFAAWVQLKSAPSAIKAATLLALALLLAPIALFIVSYLVSPTYVGRYMIPSAIGVAILAAAWAQNNRSAAPRKSLVWSIVFLLFPIAAALLARPAFLDVPRIDRLAAGQPLVSDWLNDFLVTTRYSSAPATVEYPLDWQSALSGPPSATGAFQLMQNYRSEGYLASNLRDLSSVLAQPSFVILDNTATNWFHLEIEHNPQFSWKVLAQLDASHRLIQVTHARPAPR